MAGQIVRGGAAALFQVVLEVIVGAGLLCLFILALAWSPFDRRLGFHARRHAHRLEARQASGALPRERPAADRAFGIAGSPS
jgi:hypothetical protein